MNASAASYPRRPPMLLLLPPTLPVSPVVLAATGTMLLGQLALPDPGSFSSLGWVIAVLFLLIKGFDGALDFYKKHIKQTVPVGDYAKIKDLESLKREVQEQLVESRSYVHQEVHGLREALSSLRTEAHNGREGTNNRLNAQVELLHHLRGQMEGFLVAARTMTDAAERAADRADKVSDRVMKDS